jgi:hypothetical protein
LYQLVILFGPRQPPSIERGGDRERNRRRRVEELTLFE